MALLKKRKVFQDLYRHIPFPYEGYRIRVYFTRNYLIDNFSLNIEFVLEKFLTDPDTELDEEYGWNVIDCCNYNLINHYKSKRTKNVYYKQYNGDRESRIIEEFFKTVNRSLKIIWKTYKIYDDIL